jgi:hypothetical protein
MPKKPASPKSKASSSKASVSIRTLRVGGHIKAAPITATTNPRAAVSRRERRPITGPNANPAANAPAAMMRYCATDIDWPESVEAMRLV